NSPMGYARIGLVDGRMDRPDQRRWSDGGSKVKHVMMEIPIELPARSVHGGARIGFMIIEPDVTYHADDLKNSLPNILVGRRPQAFAHCLFARPERPGQGAIDNHSVPFQVGAVEEST